MSRYFNVVITGGTSPGPYSIYYEYVSPYNIATLYPSNVPAINLTGATSFNIKVPDWTCQSGYIFVEDTGQPNGIGYCTNGCPPGSEPAGGGFCQSCLTPCPRPNPISISQIILYNETCESGQTFDVGVIPYPQNCFCLTIKTGSTYNVWNSTYQYQFCSNNTFANGKPVYETTVSGNTYYVKWDVSFSSSRWIIVNNMNQYMPLPGAPLGSTIILSYDPSSLPLSSWNIYFPYSSPTPLSNIAAVSGNCSNPLTLEPIFGQQIVLPYDPIDMICTQTNPSCYGLSNGSIISKATGGYGGWTYSLDGVIYSNTTGIFNNLSSGTYTIYAKDIGGTINTCTVELLAPTPINYQLPFTITNDLRLISTNGNMNYYAVDYTINNTTIPQNTNISFDFVLTFNKSYIEPGSADFDISDVYQEFTLNGVPQTFVETQNTSPSNIGTSSCSPSVYSRYGSIQQYVISGITINNSDTINGKIVFGIDTETYGMFITPCITQGTVSVTAELSNINIQTQNNTSICGTITQQTMTINKTQVAKSNI